MASTSPIRAEGAQHDLDDLLQLSVRGQGRGAGAQPTARLRLAASGVTAAVDDAFDQAQPFVRDYDPTLVVSCAPACRGMQKTAPCLRWRRLLTCSFTL
jgi:hypothetical protein